MHELSRTPPSSPSNVNVKQIRARLEREQSVVTVSYKKNPPCSNIIKQRKILYEGDGGDRGIDRERRVISPKQPKPKPAVPLKPCKSPTAMPSPISRTCTLNVDVSNEDKLSPTNAARSSSSSHTIPSSSSAAIGGRSASASASEWPDASSCRTKVRSAAAFYDNLIECGQMISPASFVRTPNSSSFDRHSSARSSVTSDGSWTDCQIRSPALSTDAESLSSERNFVCTDDTIPDDDSNEKTLVPEERSADSDKTLTSHSPQCSHATGTEARKRWNVFRASDGSSSKNRLINGSDTNVDSKMRILRGKLGKQHREINSAPLIADDSEGTSSASATDPPGRSISCCTSATSTAASSFDASSIDISYNTGFPKEDQRLKKLHYAASEIYTVEKKFVEQLELIAVKYPAFLMEYGKQHEIDLLKPLLNGQPHLINQIAVQLLMVKEAHKFLLEKIAAKIINWDSRNPNMAECLKNSAGFLKYCLPFLKEKKKHVDDLIRLLQDNEELALATAKFEEQVMGKISIIQQLDIVHQNVVRYTILLEAYKKYLLPESKELGVCEEALAELLKVSEQVDRQISLAELEKRLIDLYRRLEGRFNVFEANRHLLYEGELMKQSRKDLQPRYLILFSDVLLICKYSRTPMLGTDANFQSDFYKLPTSRIRVKAEEHGEYETHFQLYSTQKSAVFVAKTKRERDEWVKRINEAKMEAKQLRHSKAIRNKNLNVRVLYRDLPVTDAPSDTVTSKAGPSGYDISSVYVPAKEKYTPLWIPDPKATSCMMAGCSTKFNVLNRRHHCRECGYLICRSCVGYAPVKNGNHYVRAKVCPECYVKITKKWSGELVPTLFTAPENEFLKKTSVPSRNAEDVVTGTVFVKNQKGGEAEKWGRLTSHEDGVLVLCFYDAEFDAQPVARYVLLGFTFYVQELDDGGHLFELHHANQVDDRNAISVQFRVAHSRNSERWYKLLKGKLENGCTDNSSAN